jgi:hypothetical protein
MVKFERPVADLLPRPQCEFKLLILHVVILVDPSRDPTYGLFDAIGAGVAFSKTYSGVREFPRTAKRLRLHEVNEQTLGRSLGWRIRLPNEYSQPGFSQ